MSNDDGASPAVCPRCGRVDVDCEDRDTIRLAIKAGCRAADIHLDCAYPACACHGMPKAIPAAIRAFLGCPP